MNTQHNASSLHNADLAAVRKNAALRGAAAVVVTDLRAALEAEVDQLLMNEYQQADDDNPQADDLLAKDVLHLVIEYLTGGEMDGEMLLYIPHPARLEARDVDRFQQRKYDGAVS